MKSFLLIFLLPTLTFSNEIDDKGLTLTTYGSYQIDVTNNQNIGVTQKRRSPVYNEKFRPNYIDLNYEKIIPTAQKGISVLMALDATNQLGKHHAPDVDFFGLSNEVLVKDSIAIRALIVKYYKNIFLEAGVSNAQASYNYFLYRNQYPKNDQNKINESFIDYDVKTGVGIGVFYQNKQVNLLIKLNSNYYFLSHEDLIQSNLFNLDLSSEIEVKDWVSVLAEYRVDSNFIDIISQTIETTIDIPITSTKIHSHKINFDIYGKAYIQKLITDDFNQKRTGFGMGISVKF